MSVETPESVAAKVRELRLFQPEWEALGPRGRKDWLLKFGDWMLDNAERITEVLQSETGKTRADASLEVPGIADYVSYWARNAEGFLADTRAKPHGPLDAAKKLTVVHRPYSVVGVITPRNFPFAMPGIDVPAALAAGAAVLLKPSEVTPPSAVEFVRGWTEIGAPRVDRRQGTG